MVLLTFNPRHNPRQSKPVTFMYNDLQRRNKSNEIKSITHHEEQPKLLSYVAGGGGGGYRFCGYHILKKN
jgi:hypothetical protein